jgi:predicted metal-binding protein
MNEQERAEIQSICLGKKAVGSTFVEPERIVLAHWTRFKCQYGCPSYNKNLCCPPYSPSLDETRRIIAEYSVGLLVYFNTMTGVSEAVAGIEREIFLIKYHKVIGFGAGPCTLCKECSLDGCLFPQQARPSMEACSIDVYGTVRQSGLTLEVLTSRNEEVNSYGLLLIE